MNSSTTFKKESQLKAFLVFGAAFVILGYRSVFEDYMNYSGHSLFHSMKKPLFLFEQSEFFYQIFLKSHIPKFLTSVDSISFSYDMLFFFIPVLFFAGMNRICAVLFTILLTTYFFTFNLVTGHHYHGLVGVILITIPFWTKNETRFNLLWEAVRYYWLYIFASAALWKILRGSVFYTEQLSNILKSQQLDLLLQQPDSLQAQVAQYLIANPQVSHGVLVVNVLVQLCFAVGFFTRKFDTILFVLAIVFCVANYFVMSIVSAELLILNLTLLNWDKVASLFSTQTKL